MFFPCALLAQSTAPLLFKWWVELTDKNNTPYSIDRPWEFLSARSIERRAKNGCPTKTEDLPLDPAYLAALRAEGFVLHGVSRWMNAVAIIADSTKALSVQKQPFVRTITCVGRDIKIKNPPNRPQKQRKPYIVKQSAAEKFGPLGYSSINLEPLATPFLHQLGARGSGIWIAVMDGGFINVDTMPFFDSLALDGRLWPGPDFVERDQSVYESAQHGTSVLSVMAANLPGYFVGAAPQATYFLLKTEDTGGEFPIEEVNWLLGAEWADSMGIDMINASLGYTTFSNPVYNRSYAALDGRSTIGAKGATTAAQKGMIICNSAGNSGDEPWHFIGVPADAPGIIAVGAFDTQTNDHAAFSSFGPTADGRIKPDLSAPGLNVVTAGNVGEELTISAGTSIAAPILTGSIAALWSAFPNSTAQQIQDAVYGSAHQLENPDNKLGYGIPDFSLAWVVMQGLTVYSSRYLTGYDADRDILKFLFFQETIKDHRMFTVEDIFGRQQIEGLLEVQGKNPQFVTVQGLDALPAGVYFLRTKGVRHRFCKIK
jgi:serine protease AprX